ncbi:hypothetical protein MHYP_G00058020 [Metynnis hypsauchen]
MGGSSRRSPAGAQRQRDRGHGDAEAEKTGGRKRGLMLENDLRARGPAGQSNHEIEAGFLEVGWSSRYSFYIIQRE